MRMNSRIWISLIALLFLATACGDDGGDDGDQPDTGPDDPPADAAPSPDAPDPRPDGPDHLVISEVSVRNNNTEFIEIYNPTSAAVALDDYYISDDHEYYLLPSVIAGNDTLPNFSLTDFVARFPAGSSIPADGVIVIAVNYGEYKIGFVDEALEPDFSLSDDPGDEVNPPAGTLMLDPGQGVTPAVPLLNNVAVPGVDPADPNLANDGEGVVLFRWDGLSDLITDVDMLHAGNPPEQVNRFDSKGGKLVDGPDADNNTTPYQNEGRIVAIPNVPQEDPVVSFQRQSFEIDEVTTGGNGVGGHDETSEDTAKSFPRNSQDLYSSPTPGMIHPGLKL